MNIVTYSALVALFLLTGMVPHGAEAQALPKLTVTGSYPTGTQFAIGEQRYVSVTAYGPSYSGIERIQILKNGVVFKECSVSTNKYFNRQTTCTAGSFIDAIGATVYTAQALMSTGDVIKGSKQFTYKGVNTLQFSAVSFARNASCMSVHSPVYYDYLTTSCVGILPSFIKAPTSTLEVKLSSQAAWVPCSYDVATRQYGCLPLGMYPESKPSTAIEFRYNGKVGSRVVPVAY